MGGSALRYGFQGGNPYYKKIQVRLVSMHCAESPHPCKQPLALHAGVRLGAIARALLVDCLPATSLRACRGLPEGGNAALQDGTPSPPHIPTHDRLQVANARVPVSKVEIMRGGSWQQLVGTIDNYHEYHGE